MTLNEQRAILALCLHAAFADGVKDDREREEVKRIAESLSEGTPGLDMARLYQDVLLKRLPLDTAAGTLSDIGQRQFAYEMAVCVCEADGRMSPAERAFLDELKRSLNLDAGQSSAIEQAIDPIVSAADLPVKPLEQVGPLDAELDKTILNSALLNGALELLPPSWASMAIIPLQIRMVYGIGKAHGVELDQGHIKEFIAAAGVGLTSQYLEQFGRKLLGGLLGKAAGKTFGKIGRAATGMAFSFATTYALGQVAKRYYAGGRTMSTALLQDTFQSLLTPAKELQQQYLPQIEQKAQSLDLGQVMNLVRGV
ncbi:YcjF family protein [Quatrionicoccus australiensis]|jgi:uncharacterized protein (DUF697 family)/uncharacterized tellurite resistance protein B-like protein|uniref:YcjF family protein n=1 Tax=Quatrionicoccus australiensis TaxID=138118 RepID=UPI001CFC0A2F|nr:DUF533 domain-containing protein [Quatrionicoccus australiensis]MCB4361980.1 DUF533 domain-containing protein [Quatrionicoccus australiensis]MDD2742490.1 DUF533 domain-containing protein [Rhodocyclaceae bacterium]